MTRQFGGQAIVLDDGVKAALAARVRRLVGLVAVAAALALLLGGLAAGPVAAEQTREQAVDAANQFIDDCFRAGGEPTVISSVEFVHVKCDLPGGHGLYCNFMLDSDPCSQYVTRPPAPHRGVAGVVGAGGVLDGGGPATDLNGGVSSGVPAGEAEAQR